MAKKYEPSKWMQLLDTSGLSDEEQRILKNGFDGDVIAFKRDLWRRQREKREAEWNERFYKRMEKREAAREKREAKEAKRKQKLGIA